MVVEQVGRHQSFEMPVVRQNFIRAKIVDSVVSPQLVATPGALAALQKEGQSPAEFLSLHVRGQWGDIPEEDRQENEYSLEHRFRLLSSYRTKANETIWLRRRTGVARSYPVWSKNSNGLK